MVLFFVLLLMAVQLVTFLAIRYAIEQTAQNSLREEMRVGARVFRRLLDQNSQQLVEATKETLRRTYEAMGFRTALQQHRALDTVMLAAAGIPERQRFFDLMQQGDMKAFLTERDGPFKSSDGSR